jgi:hypothetical protein
MTILHRQPRLIPPPIPESQYTRSPSHEWMVRTKSFASRASRRGSFSVRRKFNKYNGSRRPQISGPTNFVHVECALPPRRRRSFRPLELSIYMPENRLSPISLPHFESIDEDQQPILSYPADALLHSRSESVMSNFSIPRKPLGSHRRLEGVSIRKTSAEWVPYSFDARPGRRRSPSAQELMAVLEYDMPQTPPQARLRSYTEPPRMSVQDSEQVDRVKLILREKVELEKRLRDIDTIIEERRSVYLRSRANSVATRGQSLILCLYLH